MNPENASRDWDRWWNEGVRLIEVVNWDERVVRRQARDLAERRDVPFWEWSAVTGLLRPGDAIGGHLTRDPDTFLERAWTASEGVIVAWDLALEGLSPFARRSLKEIARRDAPLMLIASAPIGYPLPASLKHDSLTVVGGQPSHKMRTWQSSTDPSLRGLAQRHAVDVAGLELIDPQRDWRVVGGLPQLKAWAKRRALALSRPTRLPFPRGVLLYGVPGTGKSLAVEAWAKSWEIPLLRLNWGGLLGRYVGQSESQLTTALSAAERLAPAILWVDEIEKGLGPGHAQDDGGVSQRLVGYLLSWMQDHDAPVMLAATANDLRGLPPEFWRPGRFDALFFVDLPDAQAREEILQIHLGNQGVVDVTPFQGIGTRLDDFSGADIQALVTEAIFLAEEEGHSLNPEILQTAMSHVIPWARTLPEEVQRRRDWAKGRMHPA